VGFKRHQILTADSR